MTYAVGLTGGIGSGKTTVANLFAELGVTLIDTDAIAHELTAPLGAAIEPIRTAFGEDYIRADGALDRQRMRERVFASPMHKQQLEGILHPLIREQVWVRAAQVQTGYCMIVIPLLVESGTWKRQLQRVLVVDCDETTQVQRVMQRSALSEASVRAIMRNQASRADRLAAADDVIANKGDLVEITPLVFSLHHKYWEESKQRL